MSSGQADSAGGPQCCPACDDGTGSSVFPHYGVAPHLCGWRMGMPAIGSSVELPCAQWPANFEPDPDAPSVDGYPGAGSYRYCLECGAGDRP
jgi:hypothetical protein